MDPTQAIILGFIQGITEWLPISSTGHLRITEAFFGLKLPLFFDFTLHIGTLIVVLLFFRKDLRTSLMALLRKDFKSENLNVFALLLVGSTPTAVIGIGLTIVEEAHFSNVLLIAGAFAVSGIVLYLSKNKTEGKKEITFIEALAIGTAQGIALVPGLTRSGLTIATALFLGVKQEKAFKFSFFLSVPAVIGALALTLYEQNMTLTFPGVGFQEILLGIGLSLAVGYFSLGLLRKLLFAKKFYLFAFYCWSVAIVVLLLSRVFQ